MADTDRSRNEGRYGQRDRERERDMRRNDDDRWSSDPEYSRLGGYGENRSSVEDQGYGYRDSGSMRGGFGESSEGYSGGRSSDIGGGYGGQGEDYRRGSYGGRQYGGGYGGSAGRENPGDRNYNRGGEYRGGENRDFWDRASDEVSSWFGDDKASRRRNMDQTQGQHRGRGPKGYSRSDDRIREDVCDRLTDDPRIDASEIEINVSGGEVTLSGTVDNREAKRHAERDALSTRRAASASFELDSRAESVSGVSHVQNNLRVQSSGTSGSLLGSASTSTGLQNQSRTGTPESGDTSGSRRKT